jgi:CHAT domain-containing protein
MFLVASSESFALTVTRQGLKIRRLDIGRDALAQEVDVLRGAFARRLENLPDFSLKTSYGLYQKILEPLEPELARIRDVVVVPSGELANLPFALLVTAAPPEGQEHDYAKAAWWIRRVAISEVPSARAFLLLSRPAHERQNNRRNAFLGFGDPVFTGVHMELTASCGAGMAASSARLESLPRLPDTRREVESVAATFGAPARDVLLGPQANKSALGSRPLDRFGVIYFATHGLLPAELQCGGEPGLVLSPIPSGSGVVLSSPVLYADEISALHLNADLVVLSACNTASKGGKRFGGGALEGLADSFFDAGARAVLASNWSVPSAETATLMIKLFGSAKHGAPYAEALRQAQLAMLADPKTAHPYFWGAFTLLGLSARNHSYGSLQ